MKVYGSFIFLCCLSQIVYPVNHINNIKIFNLSSSNLFTYIDNILHEYLTQPDLDKYYYGECETGLKDLTDDPSKQLELYSMSGNKRQAMMSTMSKCLVKDNVFIQFFSNDKYHRSMV